MEHERAARRVEKQTGCTLSAIWDDDRVVAYTAHDPELKLCFLVAVRGKTKAAASAAVLMIHRKIYKARREELYERQGGRCGRCQAKTDRLTCHHIQHRGTHGRNDRMVNLILLCTGIGTEDCHGREHGG